MGIRSHLKAVLQRWRGQPEQVELSFPQLIRCSHQPTYFQAVQQLRSAAMAPQCIPGQRALFVAGQGRGGTTALGELLNISAQIALYHELYPPDRLEGYQPADLSPEAVEARLKTVGDQCGSSRLFGRTAANSAILSKAATARYVGDKRPYFQFCAEATYDNFQPGAVITVVIDRALEDVCRSAHRRAINPEDQAWPLEHGIDWAIGLYNASCRQMAHLKLHRPEIFKTFLFVRYEKVLGDVAHAQQLFHSLGIALNPEERLRLEEFIHNSRAWVERQQPRDELAKRIERRIKRKMDQDAQEQYATISGIRR